MARKKLQKLFALLLTFSLSMSLLSVGAFAAEGDEGKIQLASVTMPEGAQEKMEVPFGTNEEDLDLPDYLIGTLEEQEEVPPAEVQAVQEIPASDVNGETAEPGTTEGADVPGTTEDSDVPGTTEDSDVSGTTGDSDVPGTSGDSDVSGTTGDSDVPGTTEDSDTSDTTGDSDVSDATEGSDTSDVTEDSDVSDVTEDSDVSDANGNTDTSNTSGDAGTDTGDLFAMDTKADPPSDENEETVEVPVTWTCEDGYTGWKAGTYEFTAQLDSRYAYDGTLPTITVTVAEQVEFVAEINGTKYETLQKAMNAAKSGDTVTLLGNVFEGTTVQLIVDEKNGPDNPFELTLDLNGYTILCGNLGDSSSFPFAIFTAVAPSTDGKLGKLTVKNGTFEGATGEGFAASGAISSIGDLVLENCTFENTSSEYWGAVTASNKLYGVSVSASDCQFINNSSTAGIGGALSVEYNISTSLENVTFIGNNAFKSGGAVYINGGTLTMDNCDFENNSASRFGGGIYLCNSTGPETALDISSSSFVRNSAGSGGGAVAVYAITDTTSKITVTGSEMSSNRAQSGGAAYLNGSVTADISADLADNTATSTGGAIYSLNGTTTVNGDLTGNHAAYDGGAIYAQSGTVTVNGNLTANSAGRDGGAVCLYQYSLTLNGDATGNTAEQNGGAVYSSWSIVDLNGAVSGNSASAGGGIYTAANEAGELYDGKINLLDASVYNNAADEEGADIWQGACNQMDLKDVAADLTLDPCGHAIDGWYYDEADARWTENRAQAFKLDRTGTAYVADAVALKAAHSPTPLEPDDPNLPDWMISKSKTATNLDSNYTSQVTLSLPAAQETLESDVVFVLDKSTSADVEKQMLSMLSDLNSQAEYTGAAINVGVVIFNKVANNVLPLTRLSTENMGAIQTAIETEISSGTNTHAGLLAGKAMLDADTNVDANRKYLVFVSDGITYMYNEEPTATAWSFFADAWNSWAGPDNWNSKYGSTNAPDSWSEWLSDIGAMVEAQGTQYEYPYGGTVVTATPQDNWQTAYANSIDKALYETYQTYQAAAAEGYHCYAMKATSNADYPWASSFMDYLAGGEDVSFADIQNDIYYLLDAGSKVVDVMGYGTDNKGNAYNFDFVNDISALKLTVGGQTLPAQEIEVIDPFFTGSHETACYAFGDAANGIYPFVLHYYANGEDGQSDECFVWEINVPVSNFAPVELTYSVKLTNPQTDYGTYGQYDADGSEHYDSLLTNLSATLYPVDSNGILGNLENFAKPTVSYVNQAPGGGGGDDDDDDDDDDDGGTNIPDDDTPTTDIPDVDTPTTDIPDVDTPTTDVPGTDLEDPDVPLADVPKTGDLSALWLALSALSGTGLAGVTFLGRKKHDEE